MIILFFFIPAREDFTGQSEELAVLSSPRFAGFAAARTYERINTHARVPSARMGSEGCGTCSVCVCLFVSSYSRTTGMFWWPVAEMGLGEAEGVTEIWVHV